MARDPVAESSHSFFEHRACRHHDGGSQWRVDRAVWGEGGAYDCPERPTDTDAITKSTIPGIHTTFENSERANVYCTRPCLTDN